MRNAISTEMLIRKNGLNDVDAYVTSTSSHYLSPVLKRKKQELISFLFSKSLSLSPKYLQSVSSSPHLLTPSAHRRSWEALPHRLIWRDWYTTPPSMPPIDSRSSAISTTTRQVNASLLLFVFYFCDFLNQFLLFCEIFFLLVCYWWFFWWTLTVDWSFRRRIRWNKKVRILFLPFTLFSFLCDQ